ncbi:MAG: retron system putative HNH endonuclease [Byssovorax sp.]
MKHVPKLPTTLDSLTAYRTANQVDVAADGATSTEAWDRFHSDPAYNDVRDHLVLCQQGLCGYCEQRLSLETGQLIRYDQQIEHVLPKSGGAGRTLDGTNFMLCCGGGSQKEKDPRYVKPSRHYAGGANVSCGQSKGDRDLAAGCDPREFPCGSRLVSVGLDGTLTPNEAACAAAGVNPGDLERTINEVLNLNCERLRTARQSVVGQISAWFVQLVTELLVGTHLTSQRQDAFREMLVEGRLLPDRHGHLHAFWTCERQYLEPWSSSWIAQNHQVLGCAPAGAAPIDR